MTQWEQSNHNGMWTIMMSAGKRAAVSRQRDSPCDFRSAIEHFQKEKIFNKDFTAQLSLL